MLRIKVLVDLNGRRKGDIVLPTADGGCWKYWADNKSIFERSLICEYIEEPAIEQPKSVDEEQPKKPEKRKAKKQ